MNLSINKGGHITDRKEIHINGKAIETDGLVGATVLQRKGEPAQLILTYDIDDLYIDELVVKPYKNLSGLISAAESEKNDSRPKGVVVGDQMLCSCLGELDVEDLGVGEGSGSITAGAIKVADIKTPCIPKTDIKVDGITARTIKAHSKTMHDIELLAKQIAEQTAEEMGRSIN